MTEMCFFRDSMGASVTDGFSTLVEISLRGHFNLEALTRWGTGWCISMHLCEEYARRATTNTNNTRNIYETGQIVVSHQLLVHFKSIHQNQ